MPTSSISTYCTTPPLLFLDLDLPTAITVSQERVEIPHVHFFYPLKAIISLTAGEFESSWGQFQLRNCPIPQFCRVYLQKQLVNTGSNCCVPVEIILIFQTLTFRALFCLGLMNSLIHKDHLLGHQKETRPQHDTSSHSLKRSWGKSEASGYQVEVWNRCKLCCDLSD